MGDWDSPVVIATRYCLNESGFEHRWGVGCGGRRLSGPIQKAPMSTFHPVKWVLDLFPRGKAAGT